MYPLCTLKYNIMTNLTIIYFRRHHIYYIIVFYCLTNLLTKKTIIALLLVLTQLVKSLASRSSGRNNFSVAFITTLCPWTLNYLFGCDDL